MAEQILVQLLSQCLIY